GWREERGERREERERERDGERGERREEREREREREGEGGGRRVRRGERERERERWGEGREERGERRGSNCSIFRILGECSGLGTVCLVIAFVCSCRREGRGRDVGRMCVCVWGVCVYKGMVFVGGVCVC